MLWKDEYGAIHTGAARDLRFSAVKDRQDRHLALVRTPQRPFLRRQSAAGQSKLRYHRSLPGFPTGRARNPSCAPFGPHPVGLQYTRVLRFSHIEVHDKVLSRLRKRAFQEVVPLPQVMNKRRIGEYIQLPAERGNLPVNFRFVKAKRECKAIDSAIGSRINFNDGVWVFVSKVFQHWQPIGNDSLGGNRLQPPSELKLIHVQYSPLSRPFTRSRGARWRKSQET
jgi:hypothetical protein